jgi:hypothetical protein
MADSSWASVNFMKREKALGQLGSNRMRLVHRASLQYEIYELRDIVEL